MVKVTGDLSQGVLQESGIRLQGALGYSALTWAIYFDS